MEVEIVSTQTIRPASPTPDDLKCFPISIFDQLTPPTYVPLILFYSGGGVEGFTAKEASDRLKTSLSETLTRFFPLAGRIKDNMCIDCTDEGIEYTEARVRGSSCKDILSPPKLEALRQLLPVVSSKEVALLLVRETVFECGGIAIGICFSHKVVDGANMCSFVRSWAAAARGCSSSSDNAAASPPDLISLGSRFPPSDTFATSALPVFPVETSQVLPIETSQEETHKFTTRRFVFSGSKVARLKAKSCSKSVAQPTRVESVSSLIWQCIMRSAAAISSSSSSKQLPPCSNNYLGAFANLRKRVDPPLPDSSFGNLVGVYVARAPEEEIYKKEQLLLPSLVAKMRSAKKEYMHNFPKNLRQGHNEDSTTLVSVVCEMLKGASELAKEEEATYWFSSLCKFGLYEAADFGYWGKPIWAAVYSMGIRNLVILSDTRDGEGIEAWFGLPEDQMAVFEKDQEFLEFASPNPSIIFDRHQISPPLPLWERQETSTPLPPPVTRLCSFSKSSHHHLDRLISASSPTFHSPSQSSIARLFCPYNSLSQHVRLRPPQPPICSCPPVAVHPRSVLFVSSVLRFHRKFKA